MAPAIRNLGFAVLLVVGLIVCSTAVSAKQCISVAPGCDTKGGGWNEAEFPHARVGACDYFETIFEGVSGQLLYALSLPDLTPACKVHDRCYYSNLEESADVCNRRFFDAMLAICQEKFGEGDALGEMRLRACTTWVAEIAEAVHAAAGRDENLPRARASQKDYMKYIKKSCRTKSWDPYPCAEPAPDECRQTDAGTCCRNRCARSCTQGESRWEWQCSGR